MSDRSVIFGKIKSSIGRSSDSTFAQRADAALSRLSHRPRGTNPSRNDVPADQLLDDFCARVEGLSGSVERLSDRADIPAAVARYLREHNLPSAVRMAPDARLTDLDWSQVPMIERTVGRPEKSDRVGLNIAFRAAAETGTICIHSSEQAPTTLNFLPEVHLAVVHASDMVGPYEDALDAIRADHAGRLPRSVNFITGPSRTGDIEQTILLGAHGPKQLHVLLIEDG